MVEAVDGLREGTNIDAVDKLLIGLTISLFQILLLYCFDCDLSLGAFFCFLLDSLDLISLHLKFGCQYKLLKGYLWNFC